jgi:putative membrane protein
MFRRANGAVSKRWFSTKMLTYLRGWRQLRKTVPHLLSVWCPSAFGFGLLCVWAAVGSPLATLDHHYLTAHMVQHLLLMTVAAPLILLAEPPMVLVGILPQVPWAPDCSG